MELIDSLYEAALIPDRWGSAMEGLCNLTRSRQGVMMLFDHEVPPRLAGFGVPAQSVQVFEGVWRDSPVVRWGIATRPSSFITLRDNLPPDVLAADRAISLPQNQGEQDSVISVQTLDERRLLAFRFGKLKSDGLFTDAELAALNAIRPHLVRAGLVAHRLGLERARSTVDTLVGIGLAAAVIDAGGKVIAVNHLLEAIPSVLRPTAFGGIAITDPVADDRFRAALARAGIGAEGPQLSIPIRGDDDVPPMIVHLIPVRGTAQDLFNAGHVLMIASPVGRRKRPAPELLYGLFDLTPAEARLADELLKGGSLRDIADRTGHSHHTVRNQMRAVLAKTGVGRQAELTRLLAAL